MAFKAPKERKRELSRKTDGTVTSKVGGDRKPQLEEQVPRNSDVESADKEPEADEEEVNGEASGVGSIDSMSSAVVVGESNIGKSSMGHVILHPSTAIMISADYL